MRTMRTFQVNNAKAGLFKEYCRNLVKQNCSAKPDTNQNQRNGDHGFLCTL